MIGRINLYGCSISVGCGKYMVSKNTNTTTSICISYIYN